MWLVEYPFKTPYETIALDELLLTKAEKGEIGETLRLWEAKEYFVVIGRASKAYDDCFIDRCRQESIPVIRRISGGHAVLQGPGCLNYSAILSYERDKGFKQDISYSYLKILGDLAAKFRSKGFPIDFLPLADLVLNEKKISGNAETRKREFFLHHGTLLFDFDIRKVALFLKHPSSEPVYRKGRSHEDFLANIPAKKNVLSEVVKETFPTETIWTLGEEDVNRLRDLAQGKFSSANWNYAM